MGLRCSESDLAVQASAKPVWQRSSSSHLDGKTTEGGGNSELTGVHRSRATEALTKASQHAMRMRSGESNQSGRVASPST